MEATKKTRNFVSFSFSLGLSGGAYEWVEGCVFERGAQRGEVR